MTVDHYRLGTSFALAAEVVNATISKPWSKGGVGPDSFSCWGLAQMDQRVLFGREIAMINIDEDSPLSIARAMRDHPLFAEWESHAHPRHGDIVKMFRPDDPNHIGVYLDIDRGGVHHATRGGGVRFDSAFLMPMLGWQRLEFWRPRREWEWPVTP